MSILTFLTGESALTKTFYADGRIDPYPLLSRFTSLQVEYSTVEELKEALEAVGSAGGCLLKGSLTKQLENEPRVGLTDPSELTDLLVIDYDSDTGFESIEDLLGEIDPSLPDTDYVFQHSASSGIKGRAGLRGHIFFSLAKPTSPQVIKQWLKKINLTSKKFRSRIKLSRNAMALCYALDISVNQNDKLIYIAPPRTIDFDDPISERFTIHVGSARTYNFNAVVSAEANRTKEHALITELQDAAGLKKRPPKYKVVGDLEILTNPAKCVITDVKDCGKFVRVNLNGGDSLAYWYVKDNPEVLHNFKGEPSVYLQDIAPEYYEQIKNAAQPSSIRPFVFRDIEANLYYNAEYDETNQKLCFCFPSAKPALSDFMTQRGYPPPRSVEDWFVIFDPTSETSVDFNQKILNLYKPTRYLTNELQAEDTSGSFPITERVIRHICVDDATYEHFIDWIAHIVQFRSKTQTAWVFQGAEGTGKGTLFHRILTPILGSNQTFLITQDQADEQYNGYLKNNMLLFLDEGDSESSRASDRMLAKFRSLITEPEIPIRQMRANVVRMRNFTNVIIATNKSLPVKLTAGDRRYNIAPRQNQKLEITSEEYESINAELDNFVKFLKAREIQKIGALKVLESEARKELQDLSITTAEKFFTALKSGDLDFFCDLLRENTPVNDPDYIEFVRVIRKWMQSAGEKIEVPIADLITVYKYVSGNKDIKQCAFGHLASRYELSSRRTHVQSVQTRVTVCTFKEHDYSEWLNRDTSKVVKLKVTK